MASLGTIWAELGLRWDKLDRGLRQAEARIRTAEQKLEGLQKAGQRLQSAGTKMTMAVTAPLLAVGAATTKFAMDAVESENLFEVSMGNMADAARQWSEDLSDALGLNAYNIRQNVGTFNVMFQSMKLGEQAAFDMSTGLTKLAYDMASFYNLRPEEAFDKLRSGITGEIEPLRRLGILVDENTVKTYAYANGMAEQGTELSEQQKVMARYGAIMEQTSKAQGDLARTAEEPANKLRRLKERATEAAIDLGQKLLPAFVSLIDLGERVIDWYERLDDSQKQWIIRIGAVAAAIGPLLLILGSLAQAVVALHSAAAVLSGTRLAAWFAKTAKAMGLMNVAGGPVLWILGALVAAVVVLYYAWKNNWFNSRQVAEDAYLCLRFVFERLGNAVEQVGARISWAFVALADNILAFAKRIARFLPASWRETLDELHTQVKEWRVGVEEDIAQLEERWVTAGTRLENGLNRVARKYADAADVMAAKTGYTVEELERYIEAQGLAKDATEDATPPVLDYGTALAGAGAASDALSEKTGQLEEQVTTLTDRLRDLAEQARETYQGALEKALNLVARGTISYDEARQYAGSIVSERYGSEGLKAAWLALKQKYYQAPSDWLEKTFRSTYGAEPPHLAAGGLVMRPTYALIGEAGPEAVVPLNRASSLSGPVQIRIEMDGRVLAERLLPHIHRAITIRIP